MTAAARTSRCARPDARTAVRRTGPGRHSRPLPPGGATEAAKGHTPPACGPYGEAGRSLASARRAEPPAPSAAVPTRLMVRLVFSGAGAFPGETGPIPASRRSRGNYRLSEPGLK